MLINSYIATPMGGSAGMVPLFWWQGWSRHWYLTSVFELPRFNCAERGTFVVVRRDIHGERTPLMVGTAANVADELYCEYGNALMRAIALGANEVHVHLAAESDYQRQAAMADIARGWNMSTPTAQGFAYA